MSRKKKGEVDKMKGMQEWFAMRQPVLLIRVNSYRKDGNHGWIEPKKEYAPGQYSAPYTSASTASDILHDQLLDVFGRAGISNLLKFHPTFFENITVTLFEMYKEGHYAAHGEAISHRAHAAQVQTARILKATLDSAGKSDDEVKIHILAAAAGVETPVKGED